MSGKWIVIFFLIGCSVVGWMAGEAIAAKEFPSSSITLVLPFPAGGGTSMYARVMAEKMSETLGQPISMVSKPGAGGTIAANFVANSKPDGYTLLVTVGIMIAYAEYLQTKVKYKNTAFEFLGRFALAESFLYGMSDRPWKRLEELIDYAKKHPDELKFVTTSTADFVKIDTFCKIAGIKLIHVPMKGESECLAAVAGGHADLSEGWVTTILSMREAGKIRILAAFAEQRSRFFPDAPTFAERGYPEMNETTGFTGYAIAGPKGMPTEVLAKLRDAFEKAAQDKEVHARLMKLGVSPAYIPGDQYENVVKREEKKFRQLYKKLGYQILNPE